ncbi:MAG: hypothetical protein ACOY40_15765, partial [Bacillota bacterium]
MPQKYGTTDNENLWPGVRFSARAFDPAVEPALYSSLTVMPTAINSASCFGSGFRLRPAAGPAFRTLRRQEPDNNLRYLRSGLKGP